MENIVPIVGAIALLIVGSYHLLQLIIRRAKYATFSQYMQIREDWLKESYKSLMVEKIFLDYCLIHYEIYLEKIGEKIKANRIRNWRYENRSNLAKNNILDISRIVERL